MKLEGDYRFQLGSCRGILHMEVQIVASQALFAVLLANSRGFLL